MELLRKNKKIIIFIIFFAICIFILNICSVMSPDEYNYSFIVGSDNQKIESLPNILTSLKNMYTTWTGRIPVHGLISLFLYVGINLFNIINPIVFSIFLLIICKISNKKINLTLVVTTLFCLLYTNKAFGEDFIWLSGSINYLWTSCLMVSFIYLFYNYILEERITKKSDIILMMIIAFFTGWSQENVAFCTGAFIIINVIFNIKKFLKFNKSKKIIIILTILLFGIGALLLICAPGNFARLNTKEKTLYIDNIIENVLMQQNILIIYTISLIISIILGCIKKNNVKEIIKKQFIFFILPACIAIIPMAIISEFSLRAMLPYNIFVIIPILININYIKENMDKYKAIITIFTAIMLFINVYIIGYNTFLAYKYVLPYKQKMNFQITMAKHNGENNAILPAFTQYTRIQRDNIVLGYFPDIIDNGMVNYYMARYYNLETVEAVQDGYYIIEIDTSNETEIKEYNVIDKDTKELKGKRIIKAANPIGDDMYNRIIYTIPKEKLGQYVIEIPEELKNNIHKCLLKDFSGITEIKSDEVIY